MHLVALTLPLHHVPCCAHSLTQHSVPDSTLLHPPDLLYISRRRRMSVPALADDRIPRSGTGGTAAAASNALPPSPPAAAAAAVAWSASAASDAAAEGVSSPAKRTRGELWAGYGWLGGRKLWALAGHMLAVWRLTTNPI